MSQRPVKVVSGGILLPDKRQLMLPEIFEPLPAKLQEWESVNFQLSGQRLAAALEEGGYKGRNTLWMFMADATDKRHWKKFIFDTAQWLPQH